jgi:S-adenosylmethionine:tRNA ribosyltransferase-isomerase
MKTEDFNYILPDDLIAQYPSDNRTNSKLLIYYREKDEIFHTIFKNIPDYLDSNYIIVLNDSRVIPARFYAKEKDSGRTYELLLLRRIKRNIWKALVNPYKKSEVGNKLSISDSDIAVEIEAKLSEGKCVISFPRGSNDFEIIEDYGNTPLPPYIKRPDGVKDLDSKRYQTVFARSPGSVAAPTAGLHFNGGLIERLEKKNIDIATITLHLSYGTFSPIRSNNIEEHEMDEEEYSIARGTSRKINRAILNHKKVLACGTSTVRALESSVNKSNLVEAKNARTSLYIYPGYEFKVVDCLLTNFHLPKSSLIALVSAFVGREKLLEIYEIAIEKEYRFYSYGDAMLIL